MRRHTIQEYGALTLHFHTIRIASIRARIFTPHSNISSATTPSMITGILEKTTKIPGNPAFAAFPLSRIPPCFRVLRPPCALWRRTNSRLASQSVTFLRHGFIRFQQVVVRQLKILEESSAIVERHPYHINHLLRSAPRGCKLLNTSCIHRTDSDDINGKGRHRRFTARRNRGEGEYTSPRGTPAFIPALFPPPPSPATFGLKFEGESTGC